MRSPRLRYFPGYVEAALDVIAHEAPRQFEGARDELGGRTIHLSIESTTTVQVRLGGGVVRSPAACDVHVTLSEAGLDALLVGRLTLEAAVRQRELDVRAPMNDVLASLSALRALLHGALRSPSLAVLRDRYSRALPATAGPERL